MSDHNCPGLSDPDASCVVCESRIAEAEAARDGVDFDPSGAMADAAADRWEASL